MCVCMYVCMYVCMHLCMYGWMDIRTHGKCSSAYPNRKESLVEPLAIIFLRVFTFGVAFTSSLEFTRFVHI